MIGGYTTSHSRRDKSCRVENNICLVEGYRNIMIRPKWTAVRTRDSYTKKHATTNHLSFLFRIREAWNITQIKWFFGTLVHHLLGLLDFRIKLIFLVQMPYLFIYWPIILVESSMSLDLVATAVRRCCWLIFDFSEKFIVQYFTPSYVARCLRGLVWIFCRNFFRGKKTIGKNHKAILNLTPLTHWKIPWCWERLKAKGEDREDEMVGWCHRLNGYEFE